MNSINKEIEILILEKIKIFKNDIYNICNDQEKKILINEKFENIWFCKILLFLWFIWENENIYINQINEFLKNFNIENNKENFYIIEKHYKIFNEIKKIIF